MPGFSSPPPAHAVYLAVSTAVAFNAGVVGAGGKAGDTLIYGFHILTNATAVTLTLTGFINSGGTAASIVWTGSTTADVIVAFPTPLLNEFAALTVTASVANLAWVYLGAYNASGSG